MAVRREWMIQNFNKGKTKWGTIKVNGQKRLDPSLKPPRKGTYDQY